MGGYWYAIVSLSVNGECLSKEGKGEGEVKVEIDVECKCCLLRWRWCM